MAWALNPTGIETLATTHEEDHWRLSNLFICSLNFSTSKAHFEKMAEIRMKPEVEAVNPSKPEEQALNPFAQTGVWELGETPRNNFDSGGNLPEKKTVEDRREIFRVLEVVERNSSAIAESYASLFSTLRLALSEVTSNSVENMQCFGDVVGSLQVSALDAATKGNRYINSCLRLNEELKSMESLALELKMLRKNVDALELAVNHLLRIP